jgi:hypothetical protein
MFTPGKLEPTYLEFAVKPTGLVIISLGDHDSPIVEWSSDATKTFSQRLRQRAKAAGVPAGKIYRLGPLSYAIETPEGELIATLGQLPSKPVTISPAFMKDKGEFPITKETALYDEKKGYAEIGRKETADKTQFDAWGSWDRLKADWFKVRGPVIAQAAQRAKGEWAFEQEQSKNGRGLNPCDVVSVALLDKVKTLDVQPVSDGEPTRVRTLITDNKGSFPKLTLSFEQSLCQGQKTLTDDQKRFSIAVEYASGEKETLKFFLDQKAAAQAKTAMILPSVNAGWVETSRFTVQESGPGRPVYAQWTDDMNGGLACFPTFASVAWAEVFAWADWQYEEPNSQGTRRYPDWGLYRENGEGFPSPDAIPDSRPFGFGQYGTMVNLNGHTKTLDPHGPRNIIEDVNTRILGYETFDDCVVGEPSELGSPGFSAVEALVEWIEERNQSLNPSDAARGKRYIDERSVTTAHAHYKENRRNDRDLSWKAYDILAAKDYAVGGGAGTRHDYALPVVVGYNYDSYASVWGVRFLESRGMVHSFFNDEKFEFQVNGHIGNIPEDYDIDTYEFDDHTYWISSDIFFVGWIDPHFGESRVNFALMEKLRNLQVGDGLLKREDNGEREHTPFKTPDAPMQKPTPRSK